MKNKEKKSEEAKKQLLRSFKNKNCFLFTGSGISIPSRVASVDQVLKHTCSKFLPSYSTDDSCVPTNVSREQFICSSNSVQPELFYSVLLESAQGNNRVLEMWNCLKQDHFTATYHPEPNVMHYFIVAYSFLAKVPVFTMNYDKMLETACEKLDLPYSVLLDSPPDAPVQEQVIICKLHGNLRENCGEEISPQDILTTMSDISKRNGSWLDYIEKQMNSHDICIWGYSGRDIDYYPFLRDFSEQVKDNWKTFWAIGTPEKSPIDKITAENAASFSNIIPLAGYPSEMSEDLLGVIAAFDSSFAEKITALTNLPPATQEARDAFLLEIKQNINSDDVLIDADYFWMRLMRATGNNHALGEVLEKLLINRKNNLRRDENDFAFLSSQIVLAREQADFKSYRTLSKKLIRIIKKRRPLSVTECCYLEEARVQYISALQMCVPHALSLRVPIFQRRYGLLMFVRIAFAVMNYRFAHNTSLYENNKGLAQECKVRTLAIDCRVPFLKRWTIKRLKQLRDQAYGDGNYGTVIGTDKYLARLAPEEQTEREVKTFGEIVSDKSALSIINRGENPNAALIYAKENGNSLNIVKAIFAKKHKINTGHTDLTVSNAEKAQLSEAIGVITPKRLRRTLRSMAKHEDLIFETD